jgi:hypothetical protein
MQQMKFKNQSIQSGGHPCPAKDTPSGPLSQNLMGKKNFILSALPFSPWAASTTWLHVGAPHKIQEK